MEITGQIQELFPIIWRLWDIEIPFLGMKASDIALGIFVTMIAIKILRLTVLGNEGNFKAPKSKGK